jgi:transposase
VHDFRRRPEDLKPEEKDALDTLFKNVPTLGVIYRLRWEATAIFDTVQDVATAGQALQDWIAKARKSELDWQPWITMLEGHGSGILAYFVHRRTSGPVEGINNKVRVVMRRGYGICCLPTLWSRLVLDVNWASRKIGLTIDSIRELAGRIQTAFTSVYT